MSRFAILYPLTPYGEAGTDSDADFWRSSTLCRPDAAVVTRGEGQGRRGVPQRDGESNGAASVRRRPAKSAEGAPTTSRSALLTASAYHFRHAGMTRSADGSVAPSVCSLASRASPAEATTCATSSATDSVADATRNAFACGDVPLTASLT